jgi:hypothetical protein
VAPPGGRDGNESRSLSPIASPQYRLVIRRAYRSAVNSSTVNPASRMIERKVPRATSLVWHDETSVWRFQVPENHVATTLPVQFIAELPKGRQDLSTRNDGKKPHATPRPVPRRWAEESGLRAPSDFRYRERWPIVRSRARPPESAHRKCSPAATEQWPRGHHPHLARSGLGMSLGLAVRWQVFIPR